MAEACDGALLSTLEVTATETGSSNAIHQLLYESAFLADYGARAVLSCPA